MPQEARCVDNKPLGGGGLGLRFYGSQDARWPRVTPRKRGQLDPVLQSMEVTHPEAFALVDKDFVVVACNRKYAETYAGADPAHVVGKTCHEITHKTSTNCELNGEDCPLTHVFETGQPFQVIHRHFDCLHDPDYVVIHASPIPGLSL